MILPQHYILRPKWLSFCPNFFIFVHFRENQQRLDKIFNFSALAGFGGGPFSITLVQQYFSKLYKIELLQGKLGVKTDVSRLRVLVFDFEISIFTYNE